MHSIVEYEEHSIQIEKKKNKPILMQAVLV